MTTNATARIEARSERNARLITHESLEEVRRIIAKEIRYWREMAQRSPSLRDIADAHIGAYHELGVIHFPKS